LAVTFTSCDRPTGRTEQDECEPVEEKNEIELIDEEGRHRLTLCDGKFPRSWAPLTAVSLMAALCRGRAFRFQGVKAV
jgi:hypothetical protein